MDLDFRSYARGPGHVLVIVTREGIVSMIYPVFPYWKPDFNPDESATLFLIRMNADCLVTQGSLIGPNIALGYSPIRLSSA